MIGLAMVVGLLVGIVFPEIGARCEFLSTIFIRLVKSIVIPIIVTTLIVGIAGHGDLKAVGRLGIKSLVYFEIITSLALLVGLAVVNVAQPGVGVALGAAGDAATLAPMPKMTFLDMIINIFPSNFFDAAARGDILEVVVFTVLFAVALTLVGKQRAVIVDFCSVLASAMFKYTDIVMKFAPVGVAAAIAVVIGSKGIAVLANLGMLILCLYVGLILFILAVFFPVALIARVPIREFIAAVKEPVIIAFSTSSSEAALPRAMESMEQFGVPREVVAFVVPTGYSFNLDGSTLYLTLAAVFAAQAAGIHLTFEHQLLMGFTMIFTSKGVAGVPRASLVVLAGTLPAFGVPIQAVALILGVDAIMDMGRTALNVLGNCLACVVMAKWERRFRTVPVAA